MKRLYLLLLIGLLILLVLPKFLGSYALGIFIMIFFYAYLGQSWNILTGYTGMISLGHSLLCRHWGLYDVSPDPHLGFKPLDRNVDRRHCSWLDWFSHWIFWFPFWNEGSLFCPAHHLLC